jgi:two-component system phosphate regulon sensor histidine kinase PhoR
MIKFFKRTIASQTYLTLFTIIVVLTLAQIYWWIYFQVHQNAIVFELHKVVLSEKSEQIVHDVNRTYENFLLDHFEKHHQIHQDHPGQPEGLLPQDIPDSLRKDHAEMYYCYGEKAYYKNMNGTVIGSTIDWNQLKSWFSGKYSEFVVEKLPQTKTEPYQYGPSRELSLPLVVRPKEEFFNELTARTERKTMMFISEGMFLSVLVMLGIYLMYRAFKKELWIQSQQNNFILSVTHELKSPLASIKLYLQTMLTREVPGEKQKTFLRHSLHDTERLERLVENVLEATRLDQQEPHYERKPVALAPLIDQSLRRIRSYAEDEAVDLTADLDSAVTIQGDAHSLVSVFDNLVENAVKYSTAPKKISVRLAAADHHAVFEIQDNGVGIAEKDIPFIFERFYRAGSEMTRSAKGTGLGLYVVKKIVTIHGGHIRVRSDGTHNGTKFIVTFPLTER